jgi:hypothetical protein
VFLGMAVDVLKKRSSERARLKRGERLWLVAGGWLLALTTIAGRWIMEHGQTTDWILGVVGAVGLLVGLSGIWLWTQSRIRFGTLCTMLVIGLLLDLLPVDAAYMRAMSMAEVFEMPEIGRGLLASEAQAKEPFRVYSVRDEIPDHVAVYEGLELLEGLSSFQFARYVAFAKRASGCTLPGFAATVPPCASNELSATAYLDAVPDPALLGLFNVRYVVTPLTLGKGWTLVRSVGGENLYENDLVLPRVFAVGRAEVVDGEDVDMEEMLWQRLSEIDLRTTALLETRDAPSVLPEDPFYADAHLLARRPNDLQVEVHMPGDGILVLGEVWTPGWYATDNGEPVQVLRVNGTMRGLLLAEGRHEVRLTFRPPEMVWGSWITALAVLGCMVVLIREVRN